MVFWPLFLKVFAGGPHLSEEISIWTWNSIISSLMKVAIFLFSARETPPRLTPQLFHCQEWRSKKPLCCTHKYNWIPEKPAQLISTLRSFNTLLLKVQPGVCRNWHFLGAVRNAEPQAYPIAASKAISILYITERREDCRPWGKAQCFIFLSNCESAYHPPPFSFFKLMHSWHIPSYSFWVGNIMTQYLYVLWNHHHDESIARPSSHIFTSCVCVWRGLFRSTL